MIKLIKKTENASVLAKHIIKKILGKDPSNHIEPEMKVLVDNQAVRDDCLINEALSTLISYRKMGVSYDDELKFILGLPIGDEDITLESLCGKRFIKDELKRKLEKDFGINILNALDESEPENLVEDKAFTISTNDWYATIFYIDIPYVENKILVTEVDKVID